MQWGNKIFVANTGDDSISVIDPIYNFEINRISLDKKSGPKDVLLYNNSSLIILASYDNTLKLYNIHKRKIEKNIRVGCQPNSIVTDNYTRKMYITNGDSDSISVIDHKHFYLIAHVSVGSMPQAIDCCKMKSLIGVANTNSGDIWIMDANQYNIVSKINVNGLPNEIKFSRNSRYIYVTCTNIESHKGGFLLILELDSEKIVGKVNLGPVPMHLTEANDGKHILVTSMDKGVLYVIDTDFIDVSFEIEANSMANHVIICEKKGYAYVSNTGDNSVSVIDWINNKKITDIKVGNEPNGLLYIP